MHRRAGVSNGRFRLTPRLATRFVVGLAVVAIVGLLLITSLPEVAAAAAPDPSPPTTIDDFLPQSQTLGECLGTLERPGCGSGARGGWRQALVFVVMGVGMAIVFGRIAWAVRKNQRT